MNSAAGQKGFVFGGGAYLRDGKTAYALSIVDLDADQPVATPLPVSFLVHGVVFDPTQPTRAALFEKKGPGACVVDLQTRSVTRTIATPPTRRFYGHGAFSRDGRLLYATESLLDHDLPGLLVVRDGQTLREIGTLPTYGTAPHDCVLIEDGRTMVVANGGGPLGGAEPCVTYIDLSSERLLERVPLGAARHNAGHVAVNAAGDLAIVSAPRDGLGRDALGAVTLRAAGRDAVTISRPHHAVRRMVGESLSVLIDDRDRTVLATHPLGDCVSVWRMDDASLVDLIEAYNPRGLAHSLDGAWLLVSHTTEDSVAISIYDAVSRQPTGRTIQPSFASGSHLFVHNLRAAQTVAPAP